MGTKSIDKVPWPPNEPCPNASLTEWLKASQFFYANYKKLSDHLNTYTDPQLTNPLTKLPSTGRCSAEELVALLSLMQQELKTLLLDISLPKENTPVTRQINEQLATHASRLNRLNRRAQTMLGLLTN